MKILLLYLLVAVSSASIFNNVVEDWFSWDDVVTPREQPAPPPAAWERADDSEFLIGVGMSDITGPAAEIGMMGYASLEQHTNGIHLRLFSRAFIFDDGAKRSVYVCGDMMGGTQIVKIKVIEKLQELYGDLYNQENLVISATHTHSGPAGYFQYVLFSITNLGFISDTFDTIVDGIVLSIVEAHEDMAPGYIYYTQDELTNASKNRSPTSYLENPQEERDLYEHDTDKTFTLLKLTDVENNPRGMLCWFAVHPTSMNNTNGLISSDNKGLASIMFETQMEPGKFPGHTKFVASFAQANLGDSSPNLVGPYCHDTGEPCDILHSTCGGYVKECYSDGPGADMFESTKIIGERQFNKAWDLFHGDKFDKIHGTVSYIQQNLDMTNQTVRYTEAEGKLAGMQGNTCKPAMGYAFAAGTTDGPGMFDFSQGDIDGNPFWNVVRSIIHDPSQEMIDCQYPKPVLLACGEMDVPYNWQPKIIGTQMLKVGNLAIAVMPGEFTTMSGRRIREAVRETIKENGGPEDQKVVIAGIANIYTDYVATYEEYLVQRYEAASTAYGPHTLQAYVQQFRYLTKNLQTNTAIPLGPPTPNDYDKQLSFVTPVVFDKAPINKKFGDVVLQPTPNAYKGDTVKVKFVGGHPRNNQQLGSSFLTVEWENPETNEWEVVAIDSHWETKYQWIRTNTILGESEVKIKWTIPDTAEVGYYRITHSGHSKSVMREITPYHGVSNTFHVDNRPQHTRLFYNRHQEKKKRVHENYTFRK